MKRIVLLVVVLLIATLPAGCKSGLEPSLMKLSVKPLADFVIEAKDLQSDATLVVNVALKGAAALPIQQRAAAEAAIARVKLFFDVPVNPGLPNVLEDLAAGATHVMANIKKAEGSGP